MRAITPLLQLVLADLLGMVLVGGWAGGMVLRRVVGEDGRMMTCESALTLVSALARL